MSAADSEESRWPDLATASIETQSMPQHGGPALELGDRGLRRFPLRAPLRLRIRYRPKVRHAGEVTAAMVMCQRKRVPGRRTSRKSTQMSGDLARDLIAALARTSPACGEKSRARRRRPPAADGHHRPSAAGADDDHDGPTGHGDNHEPTRPPTGPRPAGTVRELRRRAQRRQRQAGLRPVRARSASTRSSCPSRTPTARSRSTARSATTIPRGRPRSSPRPCAASRSSRKARGRRSSPRWSPATSHSDSRRSTTTSST